MRVKEEQRLRLYDSQEGGPVQASSSTHSGGRCFDTNRHGDGQCFDVSAVVASDAI